MHSIHLLLVVLVIFPGCTLFVSLSSFIRNIRPSHFSRICLILLDISICQVLCLIVSFVILSLYVTAEFFSEEPYYGGELCQQCNEENENSLHFVK